MKKLIAILLTALMLLTLAASAEATEPDPYAATVMGTLMAWTEEGSMIVRDMDGVYYQVNIDPETTNMLDAEFVAIGDHVVVLYDGKLTRSIPAQLTASYISCFRLDGYVTEVTDDGFTLQVSDEETIFVAVDEAVPFCPVTEGLYVTVYFDGMMTRSIPAQINALYLRAIDVYGEIVAISEDGSLTLNDEVRGEVIVHIADETILYTELNVGEMVVIASTGMMTMSIPAQFVALEVLPMAAPAM